MRLPALMASPRASLGRSVGGPAHSEGRVEQFDADATAMAQALVDRGVRLLALDFDLTLVNVHTNGAWGDGPTDLRPHLRPLFRSLIPAVQQQDIFVSVVTFSGQTDLIRECLAYVVGSAENAAAIVIRGGDSSWERAPVTHGEEGRYGLGKQQHMRSCCEEIERRCGHRPSGQEGVLARLCLCTAISDAALFADRPCACNACSVMLVDDDEDNIDAALGCGHLSWHFRDGSVEELRAELKKLQHA